jgi:hypothetical protein
MIIRMQSFRTSIINWYSAIYKSFSKTKNKTTFANTDGSVNKLVTLFAFDTAVNIITVSPITRIPAASFCTWSHDLASGLLHREAAPVSSAMLLHRDSILVASQLVPRFRQLVIKLAPGWQKLRRASLLSASDKSCLKEHNPALGTSVSQQRLLTLTAGPL